MKRIRLGPGYLAAIVALAAATAGCSSVGNKVLQDFGIQDRPDDYVSGADRVMKKLPDVAATEMNRMNLAERRGTILYDDTDSLHGFYYKRVKVYEDFHPLDAHHASKTSARHEGGFQGYIEYSYEYYEGPRRNSRAEAAADLATIPSGDTGRETYRYRFNTGGVWNGSKGESV